MDMPFHGIYQKIEKKETLTEISIKFQLNEY